MLRPHSAQPYAQAPTGRATRGRSGPSTCPNLRTVWRNDQTTRGGRDMGPRKPAGAPRLQQVVSEDWGAQSPLKWTGSRWQYSEPCSGQLILMAWPPLKRIIKNYHAQPPSRQAAGVFLFAVRRLQSHSFFKQLYMLDGTSVQCCIKPSHINFRSLTSHGCLVYSYIVHVWPHAMSAAHHQAHPKTRAGEDEVTYSRALGPGGGQRVMPSITIASRSCYINFHP